MNDFPLNTQRALAFAHSWELDPLDDSRLSGCGQHVHQRRLEQRFAALIAGIGDVAETISDYRAILTDLHTIVARVETALNARSLLDDEIRRYRNAELKTEILLPFFMSVIGILDRLAGEGGQIRRFQAQLDDCSDPVTLEALTWVHDVRELDRTELRNLLSQFGIDWLRSQRGEPFDPTRHKPVAVEYTDKPNLQGRIANHRLHGYVRRSDNWVIRPEVVEVFRNHGS